MYRIRVAKKAGKKVVDVDGTYLYRKQQIMIAGGTSVAPLGTPDTPLSGWQPLDGSNYAVLAKKMP